MGLPEFLESVREVLQLIDKCQEVLFRRRFRQNLSPAIQDAMDLLNHRIRLIRAGRMSGGLGAAGLEGPQLQLKMDAYSTQLEEYRVTAHPRNLKGLLDTAATIAKSIAGAIPAFGSFLSELLDFILQEFKDSWKLWR